MGNNTQGVKGVRATAYDEMCAYDKLPLSMRKLLREAPISFSAPQALKVGSRPCYRNNPKKRAEDFKNSVGRYMADGQGSTRNIYGPTHPQAAPQHTGG